MLAKKALSRTAWRFFFDLFHCFEALAVNGKMRKNKENCSEKMEFR